MADFFNIARHIVEQKAETLFKAKNPDVLVFRVVRQPLLNGMRADIILYTSKGEQKMTVFSHQF